MKTTLRLALSSAVLATAFLHTPSATAEAPELAGTCGAESTYDLDIGPEWLHFQREQSRPGDVRIGAGRLQLGRQDTTVNLEDRDRLVLFEQVLRSLVPDVKGVAKRGVDLALEAVREEMRSVTGAPPSAQAEAQLRNRRDQVHARIDASSSTRDWQGEAFEREMQAMANELVPILAADVARRGMELAMAGDMARAAALQRQTQNLPQTMRARIERSLEPLQSEVARLCPRVRELAELNQGMSLRLDDGQRLELLRLRN